MSELKVWVRRQWNDWRKALYSLDDVDNLRWDTVSGGVNAKAPQPFLHGYAWCDAMLEGELAHSCMHGAGPHHIKVAITKIDNTPVVFRQLVEIAGPKPKWGKKWAKRQDD